MSINNKQGHIGRKSKRKSLRRYWTSRYLASLCVGLIIVALLSALWIRHTTLENRLNLMTLLTENIAEQIAATNKQQKSPPDFFQEREIRKELAIDPFTFIVDADGTLISSNRPSGPLEKYINASLLDNEEPFQQLDVSNQQFYLVKHAIEIDDSVIGWVMMVESKDKLTHVNQEYTQLAIMIISLALLGWAAIYVLSSRLSKPIQDVADAAQLVAEGNYHIELTNDSNEKEVYELIHSFKEMAGKLERLESLRTELLAGVTHELKTPVTSISGLLQALKDEVVTGEEAKEFLQLSLNETGKMKTMVEDLLTFNQFSTNAILLNKANHHVNELIEHAIIGWQMAQKDGEAIVNIQPLSKDVEISTDVIRLAQIVTNLLENANQAMGNKGEINITLKEKDSQIFVDVSDCGGGIPENEQAFIFERFYRGETKKYKTRGLGLGLALSKMLAHALDGDLVLVSSSPDGTTFRLILPK